MFNIINVKSLHHCLVVSVLRQVIEAIMDKGSDSPYSYSINTSLIRRPLQSQLSNRDCFMSLVSEPDQRSVVDILIDQEPHQGVSAWISSARTSSVAYLAQALMSSSCKSG